MTTLGVVKRSHRMSVGRVNFLWPSPGELLLTPSPAGIMTRSYCLWESSNHSTCTFLSLNIVNFIRHEPHRKHRVQQFFYCCVHSCRGNVFTSHCLAMIGWAYGQQGDLFLFFQNKESRLKISFLDVTCVPCTKCTVRDTDLKSHLQSVT
jgi:hypothetical protein